MNTMKLFIDIETRPSDELPSLDEISAPANYKDPEKIQAYKEANQLAEWHKQALNPIKGNILTISAAIDDGDVVEFWGVYEINMLTDFCDWLYLNNVSRGCEIIGHNIINFDMPWLYLKAAKYGLKEIRNILPQYKFDKLIFDTMQKLNPWGVSYISLSDAAKLFGLEEKSLSMDDVKEMWNDLTEENIVKISTYCANDVEITRGVYKKLS